MKRSEQKLIAGPVEGYKAFNADLTCRGYQYEIGKHHVLGNNDPLEVCSNGFHFCKWPSGPYTYYLNNNVRVFKVKAYNVLDTPEEPGTTFKLVCSEIELISEITPVGNENTGNKNTGYGNTGYGNTGNKNTGYGNTGDRNTGDENTGYGNTGDRNTGDENTGYGNTGDRNTGYGNTGDENTGYGNVGNKHSGSLNYGEAPIYLFNKICKITGAEIDWDLVEDLSEKLTYDEPIDPEPYLSLPNASVAAIKKLHKAHIKARKDLKKRGIC